MHPGWTDDGLVDTWTLHPDDTSQLANKSGATRLGFAILLKFFQHEGRFPQRPGEVPPLVVNYVTGQVGVDAEEWGRYDWEGRTIKYHRTQIRTHLGFRKASTQDAGRLVEWLCSTVLPQRQELEHLKAAVSERCQELRIEPPAPDRIDRLARSALHAHEEQFCAATARRLSSATRARLDGLLAPRRGDAVPIDNTVAVLHFLKSDCGRASIESILEEISKLEYIRTIELPSDLFDGVAPRVLRAYRRLMPFFFLRT